MSTVYSTDRGRLCPQCGQPLNGCQCGQQQRRYPGDTIVRIRRETKGRKGKGVTLVEGISGTEQELQALAKALKQQLGIGGSMKDGVLEFQGEQRNRLRELLEARGYKVKLAGG